MKKLTINEAEKISDKCFSKVKNKEDREYHMLHSRSVVNTALLLAGKKKIDKNVLKIAGLVHDIGYSIEKKNHATHSVEILEKEGYDLSVKLRDCILNHSSSSNPRTKEGRIFQMADKVDIFNPMITYLIMKYNDKKIKQEDITYLDHKSTQSIGYLSKYRF